MVPYAETSDGKVCSAKDKLSNLVPVFTFPPANDPRPELMLYDIWMLAGCTLYAYYCILHTNQGTIPIRLMVSFIDAIASFTSTIYLTVYTLARRYHWHWHCGPPPALTVRDPSPLEALEGGDVVRVPGVHHVLGVGGVGTEVAGHRPDALIKRFGG